MHQVLRLFRYRERQHWLRAKQRAYAWVICLGTVSRLDATALCPHYQTIQTLHAQRCQNSIKTGKTRVKRNNEMHRRWVDWLESEPSSRNQDPNVRPQGTDYCQCFVMDVSSMRSETESLKRVALRYSQYRDNEPLWWKMCQGDRSTLNHLYWLRSRQTTSVWVCAIITVTASPSPTQHRTVDEPTSNTTLNTVLSVAFVALFLARSWPPVVKTDTESQIRGQYRCGYCVIW